MEKMRLENERMKSVLDTNTQTKIEKQAGHSFSIIEADKSQFLDDVNILDEILEMEKTTNNNNNNNNNVNNNMNNNNNNINNCNTIGTNGTTPNLKSDGNFPTKENLQSNTVRNMNEVADYLEPKSSMNSIRTNKRNETPQETVREHINKFEENEKLFNDQLINVKEELKTTRYERDSYRRKFEESTTLQDGQKTELINMLKTAFQKLIAEISLNSKAKEYVKMILKILDY